MKEIINLYGKNETNFEHNGLIVLNDYKSCFITEELNGAYSLELEYPKDERGKYKYLEGWNIVKADGQLFRIPQLNKLQENNLSVRVLANHIFYDLLNDFNEDTRADTRTVDEAIRIAVATNPKFNVLSTDLTNINNAYFIRENPVQSIFQKILPRWGGELFRDNFNLAIKSRIGRDTGILISFGKNIKGFEQTLDYSNIATRVMPVGKNGLTIDLVNQGSKYLESPRINEYPFVITKEIKFDDIEDATELKNKVISLWGVIDLPSTNYKVNFVELSKTEEYKHLKVLQEVSLGDTVAIRHKEFNVDISARVIKTRKNVLTGRLEEIELGQFRENIAGHINSLEGKINYTNEVVAEVNEDLQGTKTIVFQNQEEITLKAQELQKNIDATRTELQGNLNNTNENLGNIDTRLSEAESKITPTAIIDTVRQSTEYSTDMININSAIQTAQNTANSKATPSYVDNKATEAETNAIDYADILGEEIEANGKNYTDTKKAEIDNTVNIITGRVANAEEKITPEAITKTVTESNTYKSFNLVPSRVKLATVRNAPAINPLNAYNFSSGSAINPNELITVGSSLGELVYTADLQITNNEIVTFDKPSDRIENAETKIEQTARTIDLVVKEDGTINGEALIASINISSTKISQSALNIDFSGYATFTSLRTPGATEIDGGNLKAVSVGANSIKTDELIVGTNIAMGPNASIAWGKVTGAPFIPSSASDVGAIPSTYIDANGVFTPKVYANNIDVRNGKISANMIDVDTLYSNINRVSTYVQFGTDLNAIYAVSTTKVLTIYSAYGVNIDCSSATIQGNAIATQAWVTSNFSSATAKFA